MKRMVPQLSSEQYTSPYFEVKYVISDTNLQIKTFLSEYLVYAINQTIFFTYGWFWFGNLGFYAIKQFMHLTDMQLTIVVYIMIVEQTGWLS